MTAPAPRATDLSDQVQWLLRLGDTALVLAHRLGEQVGHAPSVEEDMALANIGLDLIGQGRLWLQQAGHVEQAGRNEDALALLRDPDGYRNLTLAEQPNHDFAHIIVRQVLVSTWQQLVYEALQTSADPKVAEIAAKALKETGYHVRYASGWFVRLGDGTAESHDRMTAAVAHMWRFTDEPFAADAVDAAMATAGIGPDLAALRTRWQAGMDDLFRHATLDRPESPGYRWHGKRGEHGEALGRLLAEMQFMQRTYPDARW